MIIMRPPQHGHGCDSGLGSSVSARLVSAASGCAVDGSSNRRARSDGRDTRRASGGRFGALPELGCNAIERAHDLPDDLGGDTRIERGGVELGMSQQS